LRARFKREYRGSHPEQDRVGIRSKITEEVLDMITTASYNTSRQAHFAMPTLRCADASWLRALSPSKGEVSVLGTAVNGGVRITTADVRTFPGTTAWSPPT
jgi:hypothetical protein